ncbi:DUF433 domain-containing protein [Candidatus Micrarchaeota archaeon]|nr:DUF433 domain-containing protein [Candidatus Micrarchaeota archaeon]
MNKPETERMEGETYEYYSLGRYIVRAKGVCGGRPTFKHTRIEVNGTLDRLDAGEDIDDIVRGYKGLVRKEAILEAMELAKTSSVLNVA